MPEIWLRYGKVEIAVELKRERLEKVYDDPLSDREINQIEQELQPVKGLNEINLLVGDYESSTIEFLRFFTTFVQNTKIYAFATERILKYLRKNLKDTNIEFSRIENGKEPVAIVDGVQVKASQILSKRNLIIVSSIGFDPLFGFRGIPTTILEIVDEQIRYEAIKRENELIPRPGKETSSGWFLNRIVEELKELNGIGIVPGKNGFSKILYGKIDIVHKKSVEELLKCASKNVEKKISLVLVSPGEEDKCSSLNSALNSLWNTIYACEEGASIIILAEALEGLGSEALKKYVYTGFKLDNILGKTYIDGLENLYYLIQVSQKYDLGVVTTLPNTFIQKRLGLKSFQSGNAAINYLVDQAENRKRKISIIVRGDKTLLYS
ncbi:MAG: hypothetical protein N3F64_06770 [Nitrososphaeria archaeon]|nr:hypothetical protein [Nitrososphaeria archaeon]